MDNLRTVLIVVASLVIIALLIHGLWINKKERSSLFKSGKKDNLTPNTQQFEDIYSDEDEDDVILLPPRSKTNQTTTNNPSEKVVVMEEEQIPRQEDLFSNDDNATNEPTINFQPDILSDEIVTPKIENNVSEASKSTQSRADKPSEKQEKFNKEDNEEQETDIIILNVTGINNKSLQGDVLLASIMLK